MTSPLRDPPEGDASWASSPSARKKMLANRPTDTKPERAVRSTLHRLGFRFRKDLTVRAGALRTRPDVVFPALRVAVYIDGCFWHFCPLHGTSPKANSAYWGPKLEANVQRDRRADAALRADGWQVMRFWEHDHPTDVAQRIAEAVRDRGRDRHNRQRASATFDGCDSPKDV